MKNNIDFVAKKVNNRLVDLNFRTKKSDRVEFVPLDSWPGLRVYEHSLTLLLIRAVEEIYPKARLESIASSSTFARSIINK